MIEQPVDAQKDGQAKLAIVSDSKRNLEASLGTPLQQQSAELIKTLSNPETSVTFKNAASTAWRLLKTLTAMLFYGSVTVFALVIWICGIGFQSGHYFRKWIEVESPSTNEIVCTVLRAIAFPLVNLYQWANAFVRESLGWEVQFNALKLDDAATPDGSLTTPDDVKTEPTPKETETVSAG
jgi:hypothetical protein